MAFNNYDKEIKNDDGNSLSVQIEQGGNVASVVGDALKVTGGGGGFEVLDGQVANLGTDLGSILAGYDGANYQFLSLDSNGHIQADILTLPNVILGSQASPFTTDVNVNVNQSLPAGDNNIGNVDVVSSVLPTGAATETTLSTLLTEATFFAVDFATETTLSSILTGQLPDGHNVTVDNAAGISAVNIQDGGNSITIDNAAIDTNLDVLLSTRATESTLQAVQTAVEIMDDWDESDRAKVNTVAGQVGVAAGTGIDTTNTQRVSLATDIPLPTGENVIGEIRLVDSNDIDLAIDHTGTFPVTQYGLPIGGRDQTQFNIVSVEEDPQDGKYRLSIQGKVSVSAPISPPAATDVTISADNPLTVNGSSTTDYIIPNGVTFNISQITYGAEGDPNEKGSKITVSYIDAAAVSHVIDRVYFTGFTGQIFPDTSTARDGTVLTGNGTTTLIRLVRERLGGSGLEIDCVLRGYYE